MEHAKDVWARVVANGGFVNPPYAEVPRAYTEDFDAAKRAFNAEAQRKVTSADGLTGKQVYVRFLDNMREAVHPDGHPSPAHLVAGR